MEFSRQEYQSGLLFPSSVGLPNPRIEPWSPALQADALPSEPPGKPTTKMDICYSIEITPRLFKNDRECKSTPHVAFLIILNPFAHLPLVKPC